MKHMANHDINFSSPTCIVFIEITHGVIPMG